jgi:hypothetical protein
LSFPEQLDKESSKSSGSIVFMKKSERKIKQNTNIQNYPKKYFQNDQYIITNLYLSIKENMQKKRNQKGNNTQSQKKALPLHDLEKLVHKSFQKFYSDDAYYNIMKIDEIINNEKSHLVAEFKDFLVLGDTGEFILKYYNKKETQKIYKQILDYYNENLFIFPNYVALHESKYIYNNIQKKQKIIDIQEELNDNKKEKKTDDKNEKNKVFSVKEIESILNETDTSGIKQYFGLSENNTENGIDKNEKQILELIDKINVMEKNISINKENKSIKQEEKKVNISNGNNQNNSKEKKVYKINKKEKIIKGRNEKINIFGSDKVKSISDMKGSENKTIKQSSSNSQPNLYFKNNKSLKSVFMNSINEKNNSKEKSVKSKEKMMEKDKKINEVLPQNKKRVIENLYNKDNKKLLNKIMNNTKNFSLFQDNIENLNNGMNKSNNKIKINKSILKEIGDYKNKSKPNLVSSVNNKTYKKELINILFNSKVSSNNNKKEKHKSNKNNNSKSDNILTSTLNDEKSAIMTCNHFFKNGRNYYKKENQNIKNKLSNSCQNIVVNSYATRNKKLNFNKTNINFFTNRNISYKLVPNNLTCNEVPLKKNSKNHQNKWLIDSYSAKEINKKTIRKSPDSFGLKLLQKNQNKSKKNYNTIKTNKITSKSPFQIIKKESALTDRRAQEQINNNLEKIDALSRNIRKIKENLKKSVDSNKYNLSSVLLSNKSKSIISNKNSTNNKFINHDKNAIKVYLINKTRNKSRKNLVSNNVNYPSFKIKTIKFTNTSRKDKVNDYKRKINFKTINYSNLNNTIKINSKNTVDFHKENVIMSYNKK